MIPVIMPVWAIDDETISMTENAVNSIRTPETVFFIIDNGSNVGTGRLKEMADVYIRLKNNLGYAKAVNLGLKACWGANAVVVANNDVRVSPNWLKVSEDILKDTDIGSVHFRMIHYNEPFNYGEDTWKDGKERWCSSSFFVMRLFQLYDDNFFNSGEDWDYWLRFREVFKTAYTNKACYQHKDSFTQKKIIDRAKNDKKNYTYFKKKWGKEPEELFKELYPEQMRTEWRPFP
jgi:glycosyltransferase involved in cell wall biosynthesis